MNQTKRCSSCKLYRKVELFKRPSLDGLFNTCVNCREKKKNNYHRLFLFRLADVVGQKLRNSSKHCPEDSSSCSPVSVVFPESSSSQENAGSRTHFSKSESNMPIKEDDHLPSCTLLSMFPSSTWVCCSASSTPADTCQATVLFHYTLYNTSCPTLSLHLNDVWMITHVFSQTNQGRYLNKQHTINHSSQRLKRPTPRPSHLQQWYLE